jgi:uncharacterized protein YuzE
MLIRYDSEADAAFLLLADELGHTRGRQLDEQRIVHYNDAGDAVAVELLFVSRGIRLDGLPESERIAEALRSLSQLAPA